MAETINMDRKEYANESATPAVLRLGFRPFFLGALVFSEITIVLWMLVYIFSLPLPMQPISPFQWHAHEMLYGYGVAVIAGFLLTAVRNWTGIQTVHGWPLLGLFVLWVAARVSMLVGTTLIVAAAVLDCLFLLSLIVALAVPVFRARKWKQIGILSKLVLLGAGNFSFYLGSFGYLDSGTYWGIYGGLYVIISLILTIGRRVIPFFIESGVGYPVKLFNSKWADVLSLILFLCLFVVDVFVGGKHIVSVFAAGLFVVNLVRLVGWYTAGIWGKPLLWSLYTAYAFIVFGFLLLALSGFDVVSRFIAIHSLAYGGIGIITLSMMARVSLGHTGRDVNGTQPLLFPAFAVFVVGAFFRVFFPLIMPDYYIAWIAVSQFLWLVAFMLVTVVVVPMLVTARVDGRYG